MVNNIENYTFKRDNGKYGLIRCPECNHWFEFSYGDVFEVDNSDLPNNQE
jgi:hypothetical protein